jgi:hypothetical protein
VTVAGEVGVGKLQLLIALVKSREIPVVIRRTTPIEHCKSSLLLSRIPTMLYPVVWGVITFSTNIRLVYGQNLVEDGPCPAAGGNYCPGMGIHHFRNWTNPSKVAILFSDAKTVL